MIPISLELLKKIVIDLDLRNPLGTANMDIIWLEASCTTFICKDKNQFRALKRLPKFNFLFEEMLATKMILGWHLTS
jgi:hypothetical protein